MALLASPWLRRVIQVLLLGFSAISRFEIRKKMQASQCKKKKINKKTLQKSTRIEIESLKKNHSNYK
jgi:hypothetical protein